MTLGFIPHGTLKRLYSDVS